MAPKISVFAIAKNEASNISPFIQHLQGFAEEVVIVVDASTQDNTLKLAQDLGAKVYLRPFDNFSAQKQFALEQCTGDWAFNLDLDERLTPEIKSEILHTLPNTDADIIRLPRRQVVFGKVMRHGDIGFTRIPRLARRSLAHYGDELVHENLSASGKVLTLKNYFLHYTYRDLRQYMDTMNDYSSRWAQDKFARGKKFHGWQLFRFPLDFLMAYFVRGGIWGGYPGLIMSVGHAFYSFMKYAKLGAFYSLTR